MNKARGRVTEKNPGVEATKAPGQVATRSSSRGQKIQVVTHHVQKGGGRVGWMLGARGVDARVAQGR